MRFDKTIILRIPMDLYKTLIEVTENYSKYGREAIIEKLEREANPDFIDARIKECKQKITELEKLKQSRQVNPDIIKKILKGAYEQFVDFQKENIDILNFKRYLQNVTMVKLKNAHCTDYSLDDIITMFQGGRIDVK